LLDLAAWGTFAFRQGRGDAEQATETYKRYVEGARGSGNEEIGETLRNLTNIWLCQYSSEVECGSAINYLLGYTDHHQPSQTYCCFVSPTKL
jgi:hypothetical protein